MTVVYRNAAVADATGPRLALDQSLVVSGGRIEWMGPDDDMPTPSRDDRIIDAGGSTIVPGMVDAHSHTVLPGGSHWIDRAGDATSGLRDAAEHNGDIAYRAGTRWFRDVGSPERDGVAMALGVRDAWAGRRDRPYVRAAGTWVARTGSLPAPLAVDVPDADALVAEVERQAEHGSDLIKLYLDGPDRDTSPWTANEVSRAVGVAAGHGLTVTAHATTIPGARAAVDGGVDCIEHGSALDRDIAEEMSRRGTFLVPTLGVLASWQTFGSTTTLERFSGDEGRRAIAARSEMANESVRLAVAAGVRIAAGTDFGGGSLRANQMAWEVECLTAAGLEPHEALAAATWVGGDLLREPTAGRLLVGGPADFFLVHGNPLEEPAALWRVWIVA